MSSFRTVFQVPPSDVTISHHQHTVALGSCFAEHIGTRLKAYQFPLALNPFGILYNPGSMARALERLHSGAPYEAGELFFHQELWHSFDHHGRFSHPDREQALLAMNAALGEGAAMLRQADRLLLTFGTAGVFVVRESGRIAANCHKLPGQAFERRRMGVAEIADRLSPVFETLHAQQPGLRIILSVSPVRHLRDGFVENQRSKAALLLALEELCRRHDFVRYFPAYELLMDDLRDYRFYDTDMAHPSATAVEYIWEQFAAAHFNEETRRIVAAVQKIRNALAHRPFHPETPGHKAFKEKLREEMRALEGRYSFLEFGSIMWEG